LLSILASMDHPVDTQIEHGLPEDQALYEALILLHRLADVSPSAALEWNPIQALTALTDNQCDMLPLTFGYEHFQKQGVRFTSIPSIENNTPRGVLGGTGLAVSAYSEHRDTAVAFARFAASEAVQTHDWHKHGGQPAHRKAWDHLATNNAFYRDTRTALETAYIRPRAFEWNRLQSDAGNAINRWLRANYSSPAELANQLRELWRDAIPHPDRRHSSNVEIGT